MHELEVLRRALARERAARREAESLLENKSRELYDANQSLEQATAALRREAMLSQAIVQTAGEGIVTFDGNGIIHAVNPAAEQIFGLAASHLIGQSVAQLLEDCDLRQLARAEYFAGDSEQSVACHCLRGRRADGAVIEMELASSRINLPVNVLYTWMIRDITERTSLERQLAFAQKMESVGRMAAGIAHEINTPIQYIAANLDFLGKAFASVQELLQTYDQLLSRCENEGVGQAEIDTVRSTKKRLKTEYLIDEVSPAIEQASEGCQRVASIVSAMKEFSHPGCRKSVIDLNRAIMSTVTISRNEWKYVAEIDLHLDASLPEISCYPSDLNQAFLNLIVNAAHAIGEANEPDERGTIRISTAQREDCIEIHIADSGVGIPVDLQQKIFEPFFTTKPVGKGTGQGLSIVYSVIVEKHGGTIHVESQPGQGTMFVLRIPLLTANSPTDLTELDSTTQELSIHDRSSVVCR